MKKELIIAFLLVALLLVGCNKELKVSIEDTEPKADEEVNQPLCNKNNVCDEGEVCDCGDCKETLDCRRLELGTDEYLLKTDMTEDVAGKTLKFVNLDSSGKTTLSVDGVSWIIERTKFMEIVNKLEITILETEYQSDKSQSIVKLKAKALSLGTDEYLFETVGSEMIIESVRIRLGKVEASTPNNFVMVDIGNTLNYKIKEGETRNTEDLDITLIESHPRGTPVESYAILKVTKEAPLI